MLSLHDINLQLVVLLQVVMATLKCIVRQLQDVLQLVYVSGNFFSKLAHNMPFAYQTTFKI